MEQNNDVSFIVFEGTMARLERTIRRLVIVIIITLVFLFSSNLAWLYMWNEYDYVSQTSTYEQDGQGTNVIGDRNVTEIDDKTHAQN